MSTVELFACNEIILKLDCDGSTPISISLKYPHQTEYLPQWVNLPVGEFMVYKLYLNKAGFSFFKVYQYVYLLKKWKEICQNIDSVIYSLGIISEFFLLLFIFFSSFL